LRFEVGRSRTLPNKRIRNNTQERSIDAGFDFQLDANSNQIRDFNGSSGFGVQMRTRRRFEATGVAFWPQNLALIPQ
jgi:hypothetical protein